MVGPPASGRPWSTCSWTAQPRTDTPGRPSSALRAVLHLPGVVEGVPGDAPRGVAKRPLAAGQGRAIAGGRQNVKDGPPLRAHGGAVLEAARLDLDADLARI